eukprot:scaffold38449_cov199-Amphora_coffeaeformis.AAC.1
MKNIGEEEEEVEETVRNSQVQFALLSREESKRNALAFPDAASADEKEDIASGTDAYALRTSQVKFTLPLHDDDKDEQWNANGQDTLDTDTTVDPAAQAK